MPTTNGNQEYVRGRMREIGTMPDGRPMPKKKMARIIYNENKLRFTNEEAVRRIIRNITGANGKWQLENLADKSMVETEERPRNPYNLPDSDETSYEPYYLDGERVLVLSDIHIPYHSISALTAAIEWGKRHDPDVILLNGDIIDFYQGSDFVREKTKKQIFQELSVFEEFIVALRCQFPKSKLIFKEGNHEERYDRFLYQKAGELKGIPEFELEAIIRKRASDIDYVGQKRIIKAGELNIIHGHEFKGGISTPVNIARGLFLKAKVSCMQGHNHATSEHTETDMNGKITTTWSIGCLSELHPAYMPLNRWNHGFAFIEVANDGDFQVHNKRIHKGEVL